MATGVAGKQDPRPWRACVGLMLFGPDGRVWVGNRIDMPGDHWQMPQGGIDRGETPRQAGLRELLEEIGTDKAEIVAEYPDWLQYDLPPERSATKWGGRYRGQKQRWFALRFTGRDEDIRLDRHHPEFDAWKWENIDRLPDLVVDFKRDIYEKLVAEFRHLAKGER
jgi:putative (di)nucleoside polyphosphate hydrolase